MRQLFRKDNLIAKRLIVGVVLFSTLLSLLTTSIQLYFDYRQSVEAINEHLHQIEVSSLPTIVNSVWVIDHEQIQTQLDSLVKLKGIECVEIIVGDDVRWKAGSPKKTSVIERSFLLEHKYQDRMQNIGTLRVLADLDEVYDQLLDKILVILITNALKTFLVAGFIILFFHYLITRHLYRLLESFQKFRPQSINTQLIFNRHKKPGSPPDELDLLSSAFNQLQVNTRDSYQKLTTEKEKLHITLNSIIDGVIVSDESCLVEFINPVAEALTGWTNREAVGQSVSTVFNVLHETTREVVSDPVERAVTSGAVRHLSDHCVLISRSGNETAIETSAAPIIGAGGDILGAILVFNDVTSARQLTQELNWNASHDPLTRLPNRREFERRLQLAIPANENETVSHIILFMDLDQFKVVNDTCGHAAGDNLLRQLTSSLESQIRKSDILARLGGDEFGVLLHDCSIEKGLQIAEQLRKTVDSFRFIWQEKSFRIGVSIGFVSIREDDSVTNYIHHADMACYEAKAAGRNRIHVFQAEEGAVKEAELAWVNRITDAIDKNQFELHVQPIVCVKSLKVHHYEILIRLISDNNKIIYPNEFIPPAERYGIMSNIDRWVIQQTFSWLKTHAAQAPKVAINLSGASLGDKEFSQFVADHFEDGLVQGHQVCFEITETTAIANMSQALSLISNLKELGCSFALDDFGSGLSSFAYLKSFPVDYLKIDGSFVRDMVDDPIDLAMVQAIHQVGKVMNIETIAEHVENDALVSACQDIGINYLQGYGVGKPVSISSLVFNESLD
ncbi:EAL domain-containing protein [Neptunomonas antarctica]|uniref:PAS domain S-box-containing protein/diguanylate cyclase (GGDEF) domain-containing protein n=1 Tax=Neptunomonas antarctica TaxID=619304 RepID=A0A1N7NV04_9GAMM|nr:EAL domain-containing protein [Neptunomonas antarctica]SIT02147.1 PAS domain S-box-containing protein/diguanylate cyclase (GGDEF) domain-containing protein [Neptunomonas antarctica]